MQYAWWWSIKLTISYLFPTSYIITVTVTLHATSSKVLCQVQISVCLGLILLDALDEVIVFIDYSSVFV
jgi:hypothetical protein